MLNRNRLAAICDTALEAESAMRIAVAILCGLEEQVEKKHGESLADIRRVLSGSQKALGSVSDFLTEIEVGQHGEIIA